MIFLARSPVYTVLLIVIGCCLLISSAISLRIENCQTNWVTTILDSNPQNTLRYNGKIVAELAWNKTYGVALVKNVTFSGIVQYKDENTKNLSLEISSMKAVRIQRFIEFGRKGLKDNVKGQCSLGFLYDYNISLDIPYALEDAIISHAEKCIEDKICDFDPESHRIGDDIHVKSSNRKEKHRTTSQGTLNAAVDFAVDKLIKGLIDADKTLLTIPEFAVSVFPVEFSCSGGTVDILKYIKRAEDVLIQHEGHRFIIETSLSLTGGHSELHKVSVKSSLGNFIDGELPVNMTGVSCRVNVIFDYEQTPCKITATEIKLNISPDQVDFSPLKIKVLGYEITNVDTILKTLFVKSLTINAIADKLADLLKTQLDALNCEDYRDLLFKLEMKD